MLGAAVHEHAQVAVPVVPFESATQMAQIDAQLKPRPSLGTGTRHRYRHRYSTSQVRAYGCRINTDVIPDNYRIIIPNNTLPAERYYV